MEDSTSKALRYVDKNFDHFIDDLNALCRFESISTLPENKPQMIETAIWLKKHLQKVGLNNSQVIPFKGSPFVYADYLTVEGAPTILIYGHYDVQPVDPLDLWDNLPFDPTCKGEYIYARGVSDMKGPIIMTIKAVEAMLQTGGLPVNVRFLLEGEEEIGSPNIKSFLEENKELLSSDISLNVDMTMALPEQPTIHIGLRGLCYYELTLTGPSKDLHSGMFGGVVHNPAQVLCEILAAMHDANGLVTMPGYYDDVRPIAAAERRTIEELKLDGAYYQEQTGVPEIWGDKMFSPYERVVSRPTFEINGISSGFTGVGAKTVIPSTAMAKVSFRLVPDQDPAVVHDQFLKKLRELIPATVQWELKQVSSSHPVYLDPQSNVCAAMKRSLQKVWTKEPVFLREGGSVPIVAALRQVMNMDSILTGFGLPDDNIHSPNERLHIPTWKKGIESTIYFLEEYRESVNG